MIINIELSRIQGNPWQTRTGEPDPEYIKSLALDIAANGLLQAPVGRAMDATGNPMTFEGNQAAMDDNLEFRNWNIQLAFGHNRLAAYKYLYDIRDHTNIPGDYSTMPIDIRTLDDQQMAIMAWSENEKRRDVSPIERAKAIEQRMADFGWSQQEVADQLGLARPTVSNILRLLKLPQHIQDAVQTGDISARVASALLPMYELPQHVIDEANRGYYARPKDAEKAALDGESSDSIRRDVEAIYKVFTRPLQKAEFGLDQLFPEGTRVLGYDHDAGGRLTVYCGLCRTCDKRLKDTGNICLDLGCYTAKTTLHRRMYLANAAGACGIEVVDPNKGGSTTPLPYNDDKAEQIIASKCENLRLVYTERTEKDVRHVAGHPHALIVCDKRNGSCTCQRGLELASRQVIKAQPEPEYTDDDPLGDNYDDAAVVESVRAQTTALDPKQLEEIARQARRAKMDVGEHFNEAREKVKKVLVDGLRSQQPGALYVGFFGSYWVRPDSLVLENIYKKAAASALQAIIPTNADSVDELYEMINIKLATLELDPVHPYETLAETFAKENDDENPT